MEWRLFGSGSFLDPEDEQWQIELWRYFLVLFSSQVNFQQTPLVLPTKQFFPPTDKKGHERAEHIFQSVKKQARMSSWPCRLLAQPERPPLTAGSRAVLEPIKHGPGGTFGYEGEDVVITYDPADIEDPGRLIATLAHELSHYLLAHRDGELPGGDALEEPATDVMTVYMGFGVFGAASAFNFQADDTGWRWSRGGYLSQRAWLFALGIFLELRHLPPDTVKPFLKQHLYSDLNEAIRYLRRRTIVAAIIGAN